MPNILIVEKNGNIKEVSLKSLNESDFYKKAGFKSNEGFKCFTTWNTKLENKQYSVLLYGKTNGRANQENKYEFPPPVDETLFFGNCVLVNNTSEEFTAKIWDQLYNNLYGGFDDLCDDDSENSDVSDDSVDGMNVTKSGYMKDGFIVDDDDDCDDDYESEEEEDEPDDDDDFKPRSKKAKKPKKAKTVTSKSKSKNIFVEKQEPVEPVFLDCTSELEEEDYV